MLNNINIQIVNVLIEITKSFDKDIKNLSQLEQDKVKQRINSLIESFRVTGRIRELYRIRKIRLPLNLTSSLFICKIDVELRMILTFEDDPLFSRKILTLFHLVKRKDLDKSFKSIEESLYQDLLNSKNEIYGRD